MLLKRHYCVESQRLLYGVATPDPRRAPLADVLQRLGHLGRVRLRRNRLVNLRDLPFRVDEERLSFRDAEDEVHAVATDHVALVIREERKRELVFLRELLLRLDGVFRHAYHGHVLRKFRTFVPEGLRLDRSTGGVGPRKEVEDDALSAKIREAHALPVLVGEREIRRGHAGLERRGRKESHIPSAAEG